VKIVKILVKLDKKVHFLSNTMYLLNKKSYFMGEGRFPYEDSHTKPAQGTGQTSQPAVYSPSNHIQL
jgi:hypothetical protein